MVRRQVAARGRPGARRRGPAADAGRRSAGTCPRPLGRRSRVPSSSWPCACTPETREPTTTRIVWLARGHRGCRVGPRTSQPLLELADGRRRSRVSASTRRCAGTSPPRASRSACPDAAERLAAEVDRDGSDRGQRARIRAEVARPDAATKAEAWERIHDQGYGSYHLTRAAMEGFQWPHQRELLLPYADRFFERVRDVFGTRISRSRPRTWRYLFPDAVPDAAVLERGRRLLDGAQPGRGPATTQPAGAPATTTHERFASERSRRLRRGA